MFSLRCFSSDLNVLNFSEPIPVFSFYGFVNVYIFKINMFDLQHTQCVIRRASRERILKLERFMVSYFPPPRIRVGNYLWEDLMASRRKRNSKQQSYKSLIIYLSIVYVFKCLHKCSGSGISISFFERKLRASNYGKGKLHFSFHRDR